MLELGVFILGFFIGAVAMAAWLHHYGDRYM